MIVRPSGCGEPDGRWWLCNPSVFHNHRRFPVPTLGRRLETRPSARVRCRQAMDLPRDWARSSLTAITGVWGKSRQNTVAHIDTVQRRPVISRRRGSVARRDAGEAAEAPGRRRADLRRPSGRVRAARSGTMNVAIARHHRCSGGAAPRPRRGHRRHGEQRQEAVNGRPAVTPSVTSSADHASSAAPGDRAVDGPGPRRGWEVACRAGRPSGRPDRRRRRRRAPRPGGRRRVRRA